MRLEMLMAVTMYGVAYEPSYTYLVVKMRKSDSIGGSERSLEYWWMAGRNLAMVLFDSSRLGSEGTTVAK